MLTVVSRTHPGTVRAINEGLQRAPNALYPLVQTTLVQDEALKRADARIRDQDEEGVDAQLLIGGSSSSGPSREHKLLDRAAEAAIKNTCKFKPGTVDDKPEPLTTFVEYDWKLQ